MEKVNILGTDYKVEFKTAEEEPAFKGRNMSGYCDFSVKKIVLREYEKSVDDFEDMETFKMDTLRHEMVHAFLFESGLDSGWARNEEIVDWIALQLPKMWSSYKKYKKEG